MTDPDDKQELNVVDGDAVKRTGEALETWDQLIAAGASPRGAHAYLVAHALHDKRLEIRTLRAERDRLANELVHLADEYESLVRSEFEGRLGFDSIPDRLREPLARARAALSTKGDGDG